MNRRKPVVATGLASLCVSLVALAAGPVVAEAAFQTLTCSSAPVAGGGSAHVCHISTAAYLNAPTLHQEMPLDCESAALAVALQTRGFALTQTWVFDQLPKQPQRAVLSRAWTAWDGRVVPYTTAEHAVTVIGFDSRAGTVTVIDVGVGLRRTISAAEFSSAIATFGGMGVAVW